MSGRALINGSPPCWGGLPVGSQTIHFIISPYVRTMETFNGILDSLVPLSQFDHVKDEDSKRTMWYEEARRLGITWHEDPRIREQDYGNYQDPATMKTYKRERFKYGPFFYRMPEGESASDVYDRVSTFLDSLWRSFEAKKADNYVIVTHGASIRVLLTRYYRWNIDDFNRLSNPQNGEIICMCHDGNGKLMLKGRMTLENMEEGEEEEDAYTWHDMLRMNPEKRTAKKREVRITG